MIVSMVRYDLEHEVVGKRIDGKWVDMKTVNGDDLQESGPLESYAESEKWIRG